MPATDPNKSNILIVDDEPLVRRALCEILSMEGFAVHMAQSAEEALDIADKVKCDMVISDMNLPHMNGFDLLGRIKKLHPETEVILITGYGSIEAAVKAMKNGAFDYITKPIIESEIKMIIDKILERKEILQENQDLKDIIARTSRVKYFDIIGTSEKMQKIYNMIDSVSNTKATILITGENGTGKGLVARAIHQNDQGRKDKPFVEVSCGALSETLLESELFGHAKGAFTGAIKDNEGRFERARGGTIFLDEIDAFSSNLQVKLLRVLQDGIFERVGDIEPRKTDARIIVATNQNLAELVERGEFREDLYYRINVIPVFLPPLRERKGDIDLLVQHFIGKFNQKNDKKVTGISGDVRNIFEDYQWPGNVRQLQHAIEMTVIMTRTSVINKWDLPETFQKKALLTKPMNGKSLKEGLKQPERELVLATLEEFNWNRNKAALNLGINRTTLYNKMKKYGIPFNGNGSKVKKKYASTPF